MGNSQPDPEAFSPEEWLQVSQLSANFVLWENKAHRNFHVEEHKIYTVDKNELNQELDLYYRRKNHPRWVAALYFKEENSDEFCVSKSVAHVFT